MMKRLFLLAICFVAMAANAQEKKGGFALEVGVGTSNYGNLSPVSVFADPTDSYGLVAAEHISVGYYNNKGWFMGLMVDCSAGNTIFQNLNEGFVNINTMFDIRRSFKLNDKFDIEAGVAIGLLVHNNSFDYANEHHSYTRYGSSGFASLGLNYKVSENQYIGLSARFPYFSSFMDDKPSLPTGLEATNKSQTVGYSLQLSYGIRF